MIISKDEKKKNLSSDKVSAVENSFNVIKKMVEKYSCENVFIISKEGTFTPLIFFPQF